MAPRFAHFGAPNTGFLCRKVLRSLSGPVFGVVWVNHWADPETGEAKRSKGVEFWLMRDDMIARWDASFNAWTVNRGEQAMANAPPPCQPPKKPRKTAIREKIPLHRSDQLVKLREC